MLGSPESKPAFLSDKGLEPVIKTIVKKFPTIDTKSSNVCALIFLLTEYCLEHFIFGILQCKVQTIYLTLQLPVPILLGFFSHFLLRH